MTTANENPPLPSKPAATAGKWLLIALAVFAALIGLVASRYEKSPTSAQEKRSWLEIIEERNDYSKSQGSLILINSSPLKFEIYATEAAAQLSDYKAEAVNRAAIYGVYRTFIHTKEPSVELMASLREIEGKATSFNLGYQVKVKVTREEALKAVQKLQPDVNDFDDLVTSEMAGGIKWEGVWTPDFRLIYTKAPLQQRLLDALGAQTRYDL